MLPLTRRREFEMASLLYQRVFGYDDRFTLNPKLMRSMAYAGGVNVGAWSAAGDLIGFVYGFPGVDEDGPYLFSQAACVADDWRGHGIGSALKHAQMEQARAKGLTVMRWAFDPLNLRNAHLNLDKLGARARWYKPDFYDDGSSDRLIVEWDGEQPQHRAAPTVDTSPALFGTVQTLSDGRLAVTTDSKRKISPSLATSFASSLRHTLDSGYVAVQCAAVSDDAIAYVCERTAA